MLGITFQQIQKYENGSNRIAPSRLILIAKLFKVPVSAFFGENKRDEHQINLIKTRARLQILRLLDELDSPRVEGMVINLLESMQAHD